MLKFSGVHTRDLYKLKGKTRTQTSLDLPQNASLENSENEIDSPKAISLESLIAYSAEHAGELPPVQDVCLEDLKEYVRTQSAPEERSRDVNKSKSSTSVPSKSKHLEGTVAVAIAISALAGTSIQRDSLEDSTEENENIPPKPQSDIKNRRRSDRTGISKTTSCVSLPPTLGEFHARFHSLEESSGSEFKSRNRRRYERPAAAEVTRTSSPKAKAKSTDPEIQEDIPKPNPSKLVQKKHEILLEKLKDLSEGQNLEEWLESLNIPKEINVPELRAKISEFFKLKCWQNGRENSRWFLDGSLTKRLWADFKELSTAKQIIIIILVSVLIAIVGFLTLQLLSFLWPGRLGVATSGEGILIEIGVEAFKQRQESAFHLLLDHAEQARPLTTAWANQYILWKYMRRP